MEKRTKKDQNITKQMLKNRLYDYGFSKYTMTNVSRPKDKENKEQSDKTLTARLFSLNNNLIKEVKQKQTSLLVNKEVLKQKGELHKVWQHQMKFGMTNMSLTKDPRHSMEVKQIETSTSNQLKLPEIKSMKRQENISSDEEFKQINEEELELTKNLINKLRETYLEKTKCYRVKKNESSKASRQKKTISSREILPPLNFGKETSQNHLMPQQKNDIFDKKHIKEVYEEGFKKKNKEKELRQSELNRYIKNLLTKDCEVDEFVYLVPKSKSEDPYDLELKSFFDIFNEEEAEEVDKRFISRSRNISGSISKSNSKSLFKIGNEKRKQNEMQKKIIEKNLKQLMKKNGIKNIKSKTKQVSSLKKEYYTISNKGLCHFKDGQPIEFIPLSEWLKERETYYKIKNLKFFRKFRKWKTVLMWRKSCKNLKQEVARKSLQEKLFINYGELKTALMDVKKVFYDLSQIKFINLNYTKESSQEIGNIDDFVNKQNIITRDVQVKIKNNSHICHQKVMEAFTQRLDNFRKDIGSKKENELSKKFENKKIIRTNNNPYENLNFPDNMSYDRRSELHRECHRFIRFSKLVDFLAMNCLRTIHLKSLNYFKDELKSLNMVQQKKQIKKSKFSSSKKKEPLFLVELDLNSDYISKNEQFVEIKKEVTDFKYPKIDENEKEQRRLQYKDYNLITYPILIDYDLEEQKENFNEQHKRLLEYTDNKIFIEKKIVNIDSVCLNFIPSSDTFIQKISRMILDAIQSLQTFDSINNSSFMKNYKAVIDEWNENDEEDKDLIEKKAVLLPEEWIDQDEKNSILNDINKQFENAFTKSKSFLFKFSRFLQIDYDYKTLDWSLLLNENLAKPSITFNAIFNMIDYHEFIFNEEVPSQEDIGLLRINSKNVKSYLTERPKEMIEKLEEVIPKELEKRLEECKIWLDQQLDELKEKTSSIDIFVSQLKKLKLIEKRFPFIKDRLKICREILESIKRFQVEIKPNLLNLFNKTKELEQDLDSEILSSNKSMSKNQEKFSKNIKDSLLPNLTKDCAELERLLSEPYLIDYEENEQVRK